MHTRSKWTALLLALTVLLGCSAWFLREQRFLELHERPTDLQQCRLNLVALHWAAEDYKRQHRVYPTDLAELAPFLHARFGTTGLPRCPSSKDRETYLHGYSRNSNGTFYTIACTGSNHLKEGAEPNCPSTTATSWIDTVAP